MACPCTCTKICITCDAGKDGQEKAYHQRIPCHVTMSKKLRNFTVQGPRQLPSVGCQNSRTVFGAQQEDDLISYLTESAVLQLGLTPHEVPSLRRAEADWLFLLYTFLRIAKIFLMRSKIKVQTVLKTKRTELRLAWSILPRWSLAEAKGDTSWCNHQFKCDICQVWGEILMISVTIMQCFVPEYCTKVFIKLLQL